MTDMEKEHQDMVARLVKPGAEIVDSMTSIKAHMTHMALGIAGEAGEIVDAIKKHTMYNKDIDIDNIVEELGDMEFYMQGLRQTLELDRDYILQQNIIKLEKRYAKGKYSDDQAQARADKTTPAVEADTTYRERHVQRSKFVARLDDMPIEHVGNLLKIETVEELRELMRIAAMNRRNVLVNMMLREIHRQENNEES